MSESLAGRIAVAVVVVVPFPSGNHQESARRTSKEEANCPDLELSTSLPNSSTAPAGS